VIVLAVDPAKHAGWAILDGQGAVLGYGSVVHPRTAIRCQEIQEVLDRATVSAGSSDSLPVVLAVEEQYFGGNPKTLADLVARRMEWEIASVMDKHRGMFELRRINPRSWQASLLQRPGEKMSDLRRDGVKKRSLALAARAAGIEGLTENEADAMCIGWHAAGLSRGVLAGW